MLDSLMGKDRNEPVCDRHRARKQRFTDEEVCKYYLVDFCPHDLFPNTRSNLGPCPKVHSDILKEEYSTDPDRWRYEQRYEEMMADFLTRLVDQVDQKIRRGTERIEAPLPSERGVRDEELSDDKRETVRGLNAQISSLLRQAESAGSRGNIEEAENITRQVNTLRRQIDKVTTNCTPFEAFVHREKQLRVCNVCGAMQSASESMSRFDTLGPGGKPLTTGQGFDEHITGKQHQGYEKVRDFLKELKRRKEERQKAELPAGTREPARAVRPFNRSPRRSPRQRYDRPTRDRRLRSRSPKRRRSRERSRRYSRSRRSLSPKRERKTRCSPGDPEEGELRGL